MAVYQWLVTGSAIAAAGWYLPSADFLPSDLWPEGYTLRDVAGAATMALASIVTVVMGLRAALGCERWRSGTGLTLLYTASAAGFGLLYLAGRVVTQPLLADMKWAWPAATLVPAGLLGLLAVAGLPALLAPSAESGVPSGPTVQTPVRNSFCTSCGARLENGMCTTCAAAAPQKPSVEELHA